MHIFVVCLRLIYALAMLLVPGLLIARLGRVRAKIWLAFPLSLIALFWCIFLIHACGFRLAFAKVAVAEALLCIALGSAVMFSARGDAEPQIQFDQTAGWRKLDKLFITFAVIMLLILIVRMLVAPLYGFDTSFRWDFLAEQIFRYGRYDFYPPRTPGDFAKYFYIDAIPPTVSFSYWWLYSAAGAHWTRLTVIPVVLQYLSAAGLVYHLAKRFGGVRAGSFAVAALASSFLYFHAVAIGQETGLTALAMAALLYVMLIESTNLRACAIAGAMGALAALSREYGWSFLAIGVVALFPANRRIGRPVVFLLIAIVLAAPWYIRTWLLTGNPFFSIPFFNFPVNSVLGQLLKFDRHMLGISTWSLGNWGNIVAYLFETGPMQWTLGLFGIFVLCRFTRARFGRAGWVALTATALLVALWLYSVGNTNGGPWFSTRVLSPALLVLSVTAGIEFSRLRRLLPWAGGLWICAGIGSLLAAWAYPVPLDYLTPARMLVAIAKPYVSDQRADQLGAMLAKEDFPRSQRVLSANAYLYIALLPHGYLVTPPWDPEVFFLFDPRISAADACRRLVHLGITAVEFDPYSMNTIFLDQNSNFFKAVYHDPQAFAQLANVGDWRILLIPKEATSATRASEAHRIPQKLIRNTPVAK